DPSGAGLPGYRRRLVHLAPARPRTDRLHVRAGGRRPGGAGEAAVRGRTGRDGRWCCPQSRGPRAGGRRGHRGRARAWVGAPRRDPVADPGSGRQSRVPGPSARPARRTRALRGLTMAGTPAVRRLGFAYNPTSDAAVELRDRAAGWAEVKHVDHWAAPAADREALHRELPSTDMLVVLGGDGTFLRAAHAVIEDDVPLLAINVRQVGFLSPSR